MLVFMLFVLGCLMACSIVFDRSVSASKGVSETKESDGTNSSQ